MTNLKEAWLELCKLRAEGNKLRAEGSKLWAEGDKPWAEGDKLRAEGDKLCAKGDKLWAEGSKLWAEGSLIFINAVIEVYGKDAAIEWADNGATVNGEVFAFVEVDAKKKARSRDGAGRKVQVGLGSG